MSLPPSSPPTSASSSSSAAVSPVTSALVALAVVVASVAVGSPGWGRQVDEATRQSSFTSIHTVRAQVTDASIHLNIHARSTTTSHLLCVVPQLTSGWRVREYKDFAIELQWAYIENVQVLYLTISCFCTNM